MKAKDVFGGREQLPAFLYNGHEVTVTVDRSALSMRFIRDCSQMEKDQDVTALAGALSKVIVEWDIDDLEPTAENLEERVPWQFVVTLLESITGVLGGNEQKPGASASS